MFGASSSAGSKTPWQYGHLSPAGVDSAWLHSSGPGAGEDVGRVHSQKAGHQQDRYLQQGVFTLFYNCMGPYKFLSTLTNRGGGLIHIWGTAERGSSGHLGQGTRMACSSRRGIPDQGSAAAVLGRYLVPGIRVAIPVGQGSVV